MNNIGIKMSAVRSSPFWMPRNTIATVMAMKSRCVTTAGMPVPTAPK